MANFVKLDENKFPKTKGKELMVCVSMRLMVRRIRLSQPY